MDPTQLRAQRDDIRKRFERAMAPGVTLSQLGAATGAATWLDAAHVRHIDVLAGKIPVRWTDGDRVFVIDVLPSSNPEAGPHQLAVYLRVAGEPAVADVVAALVGVRGATDHVVLEVGFFEAGT